MSPAAVTPAMCDVTFSKGARLKSDINIFISLMNVQNISSLPDYIDNFIQFNKNKLIEIYNEGLNVHNSGLLYYCGRVEC